MWCDHEHLHSFGYDNVVVSSDSDTSDSLTVTAWNMAGIRKACRYDAWMAVDKTLVAGHVTHTNNDALNWHCGYYVQYEWDGTGAVNFHIASMDSIVNSAVSIITATALALIM